MYVSDRRFMKAIKMMQVAAYADGRPAAHEYDCLLLEYVLGQRPDDAQKVKAFVLETIASDPGLQQTELVFLGLFGRACRVLEAADAAVSEPRGRGSGPSPACMASLLHASVFPFFGSGLRGLLLLLLLLLVLVLVPASPTASRSSPPPPPHHNRRWPRRRRSASRWWSCWTCARAG